MSAITGSIHTPLMSPYLPVTGPEIATSAIGAAKAGAAILHLHARHPETGHPSSGPAHWAGFLPVISAGCDAVVNMTTGGSVIAPPDEGLGPIRAVLAVWLDAFAGDPFAGLANTTVGFARIGAAVAGLGLPTVVVQEGGYLCPALGATVWRRYWARLPEVRRQETRGQCLRPRGVVRRAASGQHH